MSSGEDFTDEELVDDPGSPPGEFATSASPIANDRSNVKSGHNSSSEDGEEFRKTSAGPSISVRFPKSISDDEEQPVASTSNLPNSAIPKPTIITLDNPLPPTSLLKSQPGTTSGNDAFIRFLAERKVDDDFTDEEDEETSDKDWDGFEDANDNSKVQRDLQALRAYLGQDDSSCDESEPEEPARRGGIIGVIPRLTSPPPAAADAAAPSAEALVDDSLQHNRACLRQLDLAIDAVEDKLKDIRARFATVTAEITKVIKVKKPENWMRGITCITAYFADERSFRPPNNADHAGKVARGELIRGELLSDRAWTGKDSAVVREEVRRWEIEGILLQREQQRKAIRREMAKCDDEEAEAALEERLAEVEDDPVDHLPLEAVVGGRKTGRPDWLAMAAKKLGVDISAATVQAIWENYLDPRLPKGGWDTDEDDRLRGVALDHGEQDWPAIAAELDTGRTGFMCFMRYKAAVDRDFVGTRFDATEDGCVRRSVAATTFNHLVTWSQTEFVFRGRRDKKSLRSRWQRLEADGNASLRKGRFTEEEDLAILRAARLHGTSNFHAVARQALGSARSAVQVALRYRTLTASNVHGEWSLDEDVALMRLVKRHGRSWRKVHQGFGGNRSKEQLRFRYNSVGRYVSERMVDAGLTFDEVLDEMADNKCPVGNRALNAKLRRLRYQRRLAGLTPEELRERQTMFERKRKSTYVERKKSADIDEQFIEFFKVRYPGDSIAHTAATAAADGLLTAPSHPTPRQLATTFQTLLSVLNVEFTMPANTLDPVFEDALLGPALSVMLADRARGNAPVTIVDLTAPAPAAPAAARPKPGGNRRVKPVASASPAPPRTYARPTSAAAKPMVSIPNLRVMKAAAEGVKPVSPAAAATPAAGTRRSGRVRRGGLFDTEPPNGAAAADKSPSESVFGPPKDAAASKVLAKDAAATKVLAKDAAATKVPAKDGGTKRKAAEMEEAATIDLDLPAEAAAANASSVTLASLLPLEPDVTALKSRPPPPQRVEFVSNGKRVVLTKVAALPPGIKVVIPGRPGPAAAAPKGRPAPPRPVNPLALTPVKRRAPLPPPVPPVAPPAPADKTLPGYAGRTIDPWTGLVQISKSTANLPHYKHSRIQVAHANLATRGPNLLLPPGLLTMIGLRTFLASVNAMPVARPGDIRDYHDRPITMHGREAGRLWETRMSRLFLFPAMLARSPLAKAPPPPPTPVVEPDVEVEAPAPARQPASVSPAAPVRSYSRKRPRQEGREAAS